jgi:hypothetical protein
MTTTWPPRWDKPHFKDDPISAKVRNGVKRREVTVAEQKEMRKVRLRDKYCRVPLCGCKKFGLLLHVSHQKHRGMGGNPAGDRTVPELMVLVCSARHRENRIAMDRGTLAWRPLTDQGANGPIAWEIDCDALEPSMAGIYRGWRQLARERAIHVYEPLDEWQAHTLKRLAEMLL